MLYIVTTPIGNLEDITLRAIRILTEAEIILCEDTRHTTALLQKHGISGKKLMPFYDEVEAGKTLEVLSHLLANRNVALVSDAGTPLISDPGYKLVRTAIEHGVRVEAIPGASAVITALTVSGLPPDKFVFVGFPPERVSHREKLFENLKQISQLVSITIAFYCSPYKLARDLEAVFKSFGNIDIVIARELTKMHEEVWRGKITEAREKFLKPMGEFVVLFHPDKVE
jgi:16S rRNA (cytidine1402-2'-O)-methyltransferase